MKNYVPVLKKTRLFAGVAEDDLAAMLSCLKAGTGSCKKGNYVYRQGERVDRLSILVAGKLQIQKDDSWGNRTIVGTVGVGDMFGEEYVAPQSSVLLNDVMALEDSVIVTLDAMRVLTVCSSLCRFHTRVIQNLVFSISEKNRRLPRLKALHQGKAHFLPVRRGTAAGQHKDCHSLQSPATGGFPVCGQERHVQGTRKNEGRGHAELRKEQL